MENEHRRTYAEIWQQSKSEHWDEQPLQCPKCSNGAVVSEPLEFDTDNNPEVWRCSCSWCDAIWFEHI